MKPLDIQRTLAQLGYYDGPIDGDLLSVNFRDDAKRFQADYGLVPDGVVGKLTTAAIAAHESPLRALAKGAGGIATANAEHLLRWRCTSYYIGDVARWTTRGKKLVTMRAPNGTVLAKMPALALAEAALEGTTRLPDGRLANVATGPSYVPVGDGEYDEVLAYATKQGWVPTRPGYAGILASKDGKKVTAVRAFHIVDAPGERGYPILHGRECEPFRTLAADVGVLDKHDVRFKRKGGVVPHRTRVFILEYAGKKLPDGTIHDGWFTVNDTGGGIFGAHFDVFTGTAALRTAGPQTPRLAHIWFEGCEKKLGRDYSYGL